jgi:hypothetical protein
MGAAGAVSLELKEYDSGYSTAVATIFTTTRKASRRP